MRAAVLEAGLAEFAEVGYHALSLENVAKHEFLATVVDIVVGGLAPPG